MRPQRVEKISLCETYSPDTGSWRLRQRELREKNTLSSTCKGRLLFSLSILL